MKKRAVIIEPGKAAREEWIEDTLENLQATVGGYIEVTLPFDDNAVVVGNDEAKLIGLKGNRHISGVVYAGTLIIIGDDRYGEFMSLTEEQVGKYLEMFKEPEDISDEEVQNDIGFIGWSW